MVPVPKIYAFGERHARGDRQIAFARGRGDTSPRKAHDLRRADRRCEPFGECRASGQASCCLCPCVNGIPLIAYQNGFPRLGGRDGVRRYQKVEAVSALNWTVLARGRVAGERLEAPPKSGSRVVIHLGQSRFEGWRTSHGDRLDVVAAGSTRTDGAYVWDNRLPIQAAPAWLLKRIVSRPVNMTGHKSVTSGLTTRSETVFPEGQRNARLAQLAGSMRRKGCASEQISRMSRLCSVTRISGRPGSTIRGFWCRG
jgi:hypothetical protein